MGIVQWSHPNFITNIEYHETPDDSYYSEQYYMHQSNNIDVPEAWDITKGNSSIKVCVFDMGVDAHPDLSTLNENLGVGADGNGTGLPAKSSKGHGTACAGIIAASHNTMGIAGVAPNVELFAIRNTDYDGLLSYSDLGDGFNLAADRGADVINCSWSTSSPVPAIMDGVDYAIQNGRSSGSISL